MKDFLVVAFGIVLALTTIMVCGVWLVETLRPCDEPVSRIEYVLPLRLAACWLKGVP